MANVFPTVIFVAIILIIHSVSGSSYHVHFSPHEFELAIGDNDSFLITVEDVFQPFTIGFTDDHDGVIELNITSIDFVNDTSIVVPFKSIGAGYVTIGANSSSNFTNMDDAFIRVTSYHSKALDIISVIVGWIYFAAWTVSFYPQIYINLRRKSVIGLDFNFVILNIHGFLFYSIFNLGLYINPIIQDQYFARHPRGVNPVQLNDVIFGVHAAFASFLTLLQIIVYERGGQKVSRLCIGLLIIFYIFLLISLILTLTHVIEWLDYLYYFSYVKLGITLVKYMPQAYFNFKRKSTEGWSIGNILLDFTGGSLSIVQMFFIAYNYDDWSSVFGDPTKFGLGLFSVLFDILFMIQHYGLYRHDGRRKKLDSSSQSIINDTQYHNEINS